MSKKINKLVCAIVLVLVVFLNSPLVYADNPTPTPGSCTDTAPISAPNLYQITPASSSATLYFAPPGDTYTGFVIWYGLDSNANTYNATLSQGTSSGAITYTVNALTPNTKYYFKVQAVNNCATGPFSSVLSTTTGSNDTIVPTPGNPPSGSTTSGNPSSGSLKPPVTGSMDVLYFGLASMVMLFGGLKFYTKFK